MDVHNGHLTSPAQLVSGRNDAVVEQVLAVVAVVNNSHLQNNGAQVDTVEERLFTDNGAFDGRYDRWARNGLCLYGELNANRSGEKITSHQKVSGIVYLVVVLILYQ